MAESSKVIRTKADSAAVSTGGGLDVRGAAGRMAVAAGAVYLIAHFLDFGILWILQRQPGVQWEFVALARSAEAFPDMIVATALMFLGLYVSGNLGTWWTRGLSILAILLGLAGLAIAGLMVLNYLGIRAQVNPAAAATVQQSVFKTISLGGLYAVFLIPVGIIGLLKRSRS